LVLEEPTVDDTTLDSTPLTRTVFRAEIHTNGDKGVRGWIICQKKGRSEEWEDTKKIDFRKLKSGEGANIELGTEALGKLVERYGILGAQVHDHGVPFGTHEYVSGKKDEVVVTNSSAVATSINALLAQENGEDFWRELSANHPELLKRLAYGAVQVDRHNELELFKGFLDNPANLIAYATARGIDSSKPEKVWQYFFEHNPWIFGYGLDYAFLSILQREATVGSPTAGGREQEFVDFLMGSSEYTVLVELKTPQTPLFAAKQNRAGTWSLSSDLIDAESQILEQKASLQDYAAKNPEKMINKEGNHIHQRTLNPKTILIVGCSDQFDGCPTDLERDIKLRTFELHRRDLANVRILTFDELYERAWHIVEIADKKKDVI
jgi:hypothetical protein